MREIFQGWRRKTGLALLAMAMLLTVGWFRSVGIRDSVSFDVFAIHHMVISSEGMLTWIRYVQTNDRKMRWHWSSVSLASEDRQKTFMLDGHYVRFANETNWRALGVGYRAGGEFDGDEYFHQWGVQYWLFVLPLTVFSAILLLIKPRFSKSAETPKPA